MTAGTLATIAVDPSTDREAASLAIRRAAVEGGLGWLAAARLATAAMELVGAAPAVRLVQTRHGGHVGFVCSGRPDWLEEEIFRWFAACSASEL